MMMGFGLIWVILIVAVIAYVMGWRPDNLNFSGSRDDRTQKAPLEILKERYARGEITKETYHQMRLELEQ
jgi:putative membrane protein